MTLDFRRHEGNNRGSGNRYENEGNQIEFITEEL